MRRLAGIAAALIVSLIFVASAQAWLGKSVDTMKESMDRSDAGMTQAQINQHVNQLAALGPTHITVDTPMDRPAVVAMWVQAIRAARTPSGGTIKVWFRLADGGYPNAPWSDNPNWSPSDYLSQIRLFILGNPSFFRAGDIFDGNSEADSDAWWTNRARYPESDWWNGSNPPYAAGYTQACNDFNDYLLNLKYTADAAFSKKKISGVETRVRSLNPWWATANCLKDSTITSFGGYLTLDAYWDRPTPAEEAAAIDASLEQWHAYRPTAKIVLGEYGWSNDCTLGSQDTPQQQVLDQALPMFQKPYVDGFNYWVGAGGPGWGGCTNVLAGTTGAWSPRPAAAELAQFFALP